MEEKNKSLIQSDSDYCFIHMTYMGMYVKAVHQHHIFHGTANRKKADEDGCYCFLCNYCHAALHDKGYHDLDLQQLCEKAWLEHYGKTIDDFIERYIRNYLD